LAPSWDLGAGPLALPPHFSVQNCHLSVYEQAADTDFDLLLDDGEGDLFAASTRDANHSHLLRAHPKNGDRNRLSLFGDRGDPSRRIRRTTLTVALVALAICDSKCRNTTTATAVIAGVLPRNFSCSSRPPSRTACLISNKRVYLVC